MISKLNCRPIASIYIHIPFCKKACHYCDFHFSTSMSKKSEMIKALCTEILMRKEELKEEVIQHIYFGGGTPSVCSISEIEQILAVVFNNYNVSTAPEITLEANPDDLTEEKIKALAKTKVNRLSIGVQSFYERDLKLMNRAHNAEEALKSIYLAKSYFKNISIDLIYGIPGLTNEQWFENLKKTIDLDIPHISCYALTVEDNTALKKFIEKGVIDGVNDTQSSEQYHMLVNTFEKAGYINYEFSNFGKTGYFSGNNTAYWQRKSYIGIGPSAHSFNGKERSWNVSNNILYIKNINNGIRPFENEKLSIADQFNEYIMTGLRTIWGISLAKVEKDFGMQFVYHFIKLTQKHLDDELMYQVNDHYHLTKKGKFFGDGIASDLFFIPLDKDL